MRYDITWRIEVEADSAEDAARQAREIQRDRCSTATVFDVVDQNRHIRTVDLTGADGQP